MTLQMCYWYDPEVLLQLTAHKRRSAYFKVISSQQSEIWL